MPSRGRPRRMVMNCLILEDQVLLADLLARNLAAYPGLKVVGIAGSVAEGQRLCQEHSPDLLVVDLLLPDGLGMEVAEQLVHDRPEARVIVLSAECQRLQCSRHLHNAIVAVIDKTEALEKLQHQVRRLLVEARLAGEGTDGGEVPAGAPAHWDRLTRRERDLICPASLGAEPGRGLSRRRGQGCAGLYCCRDLALQLGGHPARRQQLAQVLGREGAPARRIHQQAVPEHGLVPESQIKR